MYKNLKRAIETHEAETLAKFAHDLENKTAGDILASWYLMQYATPKTAEALKAAKPDEVPTAETLAKMKAKKAREEAKATAKRLEKVAEAEAAKLPESVNISVEFVRSRVWGWNPHATIRGEQCRTEGSASGCGYDKESAAISYAMNEHPEILKIIYNHAEQGQPFPYAVHIFAGLPSFDGGCGVSCFYHIFEACGYEWQQVANGRTYSEYTLTRKH